MNRHVTIGTAGHVDHGKTALVKMLTGVDTDRWEEEKRRGITMDLGFAPLDLGGDLTASIVDVPGHEDFVRNMVAGATGIDLALLVVAADEGVMPQTIEHLAILDFLGVGAGVVALTKTDLVDDDWIQLVMEDVAERIGKTGIAWEIPIPCSAAQGLGGDDLLQAVRHAVARAAARAADDLFRLPVDRVFSVAGAGTVVTGTAWSGSVGIGDEVRVLPGDGRSRVRGIQVHDVPRERAEPGRRTALALPDLDKSAIERGAVVVADGAWMSTTRLDIMLTLLPNAKPISQRSRVRVHLGTAEVMARVTPADTRIDPGATGAARLRLEKPIVARWGDRGVLRAYSPVTTIAGLVVVDPFPPDRPRRPKDVARRASRDMAARLGAFVEVARDAGLPLADLTVRLGVSPARAAQVVEGEPPAGLVVLNDRFVAAQAIDRGRRDVLYVLEHYHRANPMESGMPLDQLRDIASAPIRDHVLRHLEQEGAVVMEGSTARLGAHAAQIPAAELSAARDIEARLDAAGRQGLAVKELDGTWDADRAQRILEHLVRAESVRRLRDRYYRSEALDELIGAVVGTVRERGAATPADLRAATGLTRKTLIPLLEWLDEQDITRRQGDTRVLGSRAE